MLFVYEQINFFELDGFPSQVCYTTRNFWPRDHEIVSLLLN